MELRTVKVKLDIIDPNIQETIKETMIQCQSVFDYFSRLGCEHKSTSYPTLHKYGYYVMKEKYPNLPTVYIVSTAKQALGALKAWNTSARTKLRKLHRHEYNLKKNDPKNKLPKILENIDKTKLLYWKYDGSKTSMQLCLCKDTLSRRGNLTTFSSINKRIRVLHDIPQWFIDKYNINTNNIQSGQLKYYPKTNEFILNIGYKIDTKEPIGSDIIGIDRGLYNLATLSNGKIISSKKCKSIKRKYQYLRTKLQQKGTKSAKRHLKRMSGKEKRFMLDYNHCITKDLASNSNVSTYVLEDLNRIRSENKG